MANKIDLGDCEEAIRALEKECGSEVYRISAATTSGVQALMDKVGDVLATLPELAPMEFTPYVYETTDKNAYEIHYEDGVYYVTGGFVEELARTAYLDDNESNSWFQKRMRERGIIDELKKMGAKDGDTICVVDLEFELMD